MKENAAPQPQPDISRFFDPGHAPGEDLAVSAESKAAFLRKLQDLAAVINNPDAAGAEAFQKLEEYQDELLENDYRLDLDDGYQLGGLGTFTEFRERTSCHALIAAAQCWDEAQATPMHGDATLKTIGEHPWNLYEEAFTWLCRASLPLFADDTYRDCGGSHAVFFATLRAAHFDAARQKIHLAQQLFENGADDTAGFNLVNDVYTKHLDRLGIKTIEPRESFFLKADSDDLEMMLDAFCAGRFRAAILAIAHEFPTAGLPEDSTSHNNVIRPAAFMKNAVGKKSEMPGQMSEAWAWKVIEAGECLKPSSVANMDPQTYDGLIWPTKEGFDLAFDDAAKTLMRILVPRIMANDDATGASCEKAMDDIERIRKLYDYEAAPESAPLVYQREDFWMEDVLKEFQFRSYTQFINRMRMVEAAERIRNVIRAGQHPVEQVYADLAEADRILEDAGFPLYDDSAYRDLQLDAATVRALERMSASGGVLGDWSMLHAIKFTLDEKIQIIERMQRALERQAIYTNSDKQDPLDDLRAQMPDMGYSISVLQAEQRLAEACICIPYSTGAYDVLGFAMEPLELMDINFMDPQVHESMGMTAKQARRLERWHDALVIAEDWLDVADQEKLPIERFEIIRDLAESLKKIDKITKKLLKRRLKEADTAARFDVLIKDVCGALYNQCIADLKKAEGNDAELVTVYATLRECLTFANPKALEEPYTFRRMTGRDLAEFQADMRALEERTKTWFDMDAFVESHKPDFDPAALYAGARKEENAGARAFEILASSGATSRRYGLSLPQALGLNGVELEKFLNHNAFLAARDELKKGFDARKRPVAVGMPDERPLTHVVAAHDWVLRSTFALATNRPWLEAGMSDRRQFMDTLRASKRDFLAQLEDVCLRGRDSIPPQRYIEYLQSLYVLYEQMDIRQPRISVDEMRAAIRDYGFAACQNVINQNKSHSARYRAFVGIYDFSMMVGANDFGVGNQARVLDTQYIQLTAARVRSALEMFSRHAGSPARWVWMASALKKIINRLPPQLHAHMNEAFQEQGFRDFASFAFFAADLRIRQIVDRLSSIENMSDDKTGEPRLHLEIMQEFLRLDHIVSQDLMSRYDVALVVKSMNKSTGQLRLLRLSAEEVAAPVFLQLTMDPSLPLQERSNRILAAQHFDLSFDLGDAPMVKLLQRYEANRRQTLRRMAASHFSFAALGEKPGSLVPATVDGVETLRLIDGAPVAAAEYRKMGFGHDEAAEMVDMACCVDSYVSLGLLRDKAKGDDRGYLLAALGTYLRGLETAKLPPDASKTAIRLGFESASAHQQEIDPLVIVALKTLRAQTEEYLAQGDKDGARKKIDAMTFIMDRWPLEPRYDVGDMTLLGLWTRETIERAKPSLSARVP